MNAEEVDRIREKRKRYYQRHRIEICRKTIGIYCERSIMRTQKVYSYAVEKLSQQYPFDSYGERLIKHIIRQCNIRENNYKYAECFDAGMLAYLYSLNRCVVIKCTHVEAYMKKVIRIYVKCALLICNEGRNICEEHGFKLVSLDQIENINKY